MSAGKQKDNERVVLLRITIVFGCRTKIFRSFDDAMVAAYDRTGSIERNTYAWVIYPADEAHPKTALAAGFLKSMDVLENFGGGAFIECLNDNIMQNRDWWARKNKKMARR